MPVPPPVITAVLPEKRTLLLDLFPHCVGAVTEQGQRNKSNCPEYRVFPAAARIGKDPAIICMSKERGAQQFDRKEDCEVTGPEAGNERKTAQNLEDHDGVAQNTRKSEALEIAAVPAGVNTKSFNKPWANSNIPELTRSSKAAYDG
jgi:hypothetical protein